jgi:hypothetical protein
MTALEAISEAYEQAKRDYSEAQPGPGSDYAQGFRDAWGRALAILQARNVVHWEHNCALLCGASLDIPDDRYLINPEYAHNVNCKECMEAYESK